jgi:UDP-N-acetylglucosamine 2-epimerase (non-hydrolysing)
LGHIVAAELGGRLFPHKIGLVIGTRPEAIKLAPVARALIASAANPHLYATGQHPGLEMAGHGLGGLAVTPLLQPGLPDPLEHADRVDHALQRVWRFSPPDLVVVQGDTSSALGGARAAVACGLPLAHVEAGLRTHDPAMPWPEESFRVEIDRLSDLLFAPTPVSAANLMVEHCPGAIHITGNTGVDALLETIGGRMRKGWLSRHRRQKVLRILVTCHRRENWGEPFAHVADALSILASDQGVRISVVLHPNPRVSEAMFERLGGRDDISLLPPLSHRAMLDAMVASDLILSDSGGVQEEAPTLGIPLLVLRDKTERPEGVDAGAMRLVGTDRDRIVEAVRLLASDRAARTAMARPVFPYGDGRAAPRIAAAMLAWLAQDRGDDRRVLSA